MLVVETGVERHLKDERGRFAVTSHKRNGSTQSATGTATSHANTCRIDTERLSIGCHPDESRIAIFRCCRKRVFRCQSIVDGDHHTAHVTDDLPTNAVFHIKVAYGEATTINIQQSWHISHPRRWRIDTNWNGRLTGWTWNKAIVDLYTIIVGKICCKRSCHVCDPLAGGNRIAWVGF